MKDARVWKRDGLAVNIVAGQRNLIDLFPVTAFYTTTCISFHHHAKSL